MGAIWIDADIAPNLDAGRLAAANVNPATGLATDYLNHFNEALMLIALIGDSPDLLEELADWKPATYVGHFRTSGFAERDIVIAAYEAADPSLKEAFDSAARELCTAVDAAITRLSALHDTKQPLDAAAAELTVELQAGVARLDAMIHGGLSTSQDAIDALFD
jgi:hypothetical protein